ncbi:MAG: CoA transferase subunit A [Clostridia bacterium]
MNKVTTVKSAVSHVKNGDVLLVGGFLHGGSPEFLLSALLETEALDLTIVSNDTGTENTNTIKLQRQGRVKKVYASYIGANQETGRMLMEDENSVELCPQGSLAERIRAGGAGIAGFLTPVGVNTIIEKGKQKIELDGKAYLLEKPIRGNVAFVHATIADEMGNCIMKGSTKNFNAIMPAAADYTIVEAEEIVPVGDLDPDHITVPGIFVKAVVKVEN